MQQDLSKRNEQIFRLWKVEKISTKMLGDRYGLSEKWVRKIIKAMGAEFTGELRRKTRTRLIDLEPLSKLHVQLGQDIAYHRNRMGLNHIAFSAYAGISKDRLRAIELGVYEVSLSELTRLAQVMQVPLTDLITLRTMKACDS